MKRIYVALMLSLFVVTVNAEEQLQKSNYPELQVIPLASERVKMESQTDGSKFIGGYGMYVGSAIATMGAGIYALTDPSKNNSDNKIVGALNVGVGATFAGLGLYFGRFQHPYRVANNSLSKMSTKSTSEALIKERMAEEQIDDIASFNYRLRIMTGIAQTALAVGLFATGKDEKSDTEAGGTNTTSYIAGGIVLTSAIINFVVPHPYEKVSDVQKTYKKRIVTYNIYPTVMGRGTGLIAGIEF